MRDSLRQVAVRRAGRAVSAVFLLILLTGCAGSPGHEGSPDEPGVERGVEHRETDSTADAPVSTVGPASARSVGTWELLEPEVVSPADREVRIGVTRLDCASGTTGEVAAPRVSLEHDRILIRADVVPLPGNEAHTCERNDAVPVTIALDVPIGSRELIDAACLAGPAAATAPCEEPVRWSPPARDAGGQPSAGRSSAPG